MASGVGAQHLLCIAPRSLGQPGPAQHAGYLVCPLVSLDLPDRGPGTPSRYAFLDDVMMVRETGNLRQMSDTQNLTAARQLLQLTPDRLGGPAPHTSVNFVE